MWRGFDDEEDVSRNFLGEHYSDKPISKNLLEDCTVLVAIYDKPPYEGYAFVLYTDKNGKLFEVHGSHCSCYGLEDQWRPEETSWEALSLRDRPYGMTDEEWASILLKAPAKAVEPVAAKKKTSKKK